MTGTRRLDRHVEEILTQINKACPHAEVTGHPSGTRGCQALPRIRFILVPQTGQVPLAIRRPLVSAISPSKSRLSLHFTQYPL